MKHNKLTITINKPLEKVFTFTITPPNSTLWIPGIVKEETNELPIRKGTVYTLTNDKGESFSVTVAAIQANEMIEWIAEDQNYHCRYLYKAIDENTTELEYYEWEDQNGNKIDT